MHSALFSEFLHMSLIGCYCIAVVLLARIFLVRCGRRYAYYLWLAVFVNLCLPVSFTGFFSLIPEQVADFSLEESLFSVEDGYSEKESSSEGASQVHVLSLDGIFEKAENTTGMPEDTYPEEVQEPPAPDAAEVAAVNKNTAELIWLLGILGFLVYNLSAVSRLAWKLSKSPRDSWKKKERIAEIEGISSPFVWGLFRPVIYLPSGMDAEEKCYVLAHEDCHRRRKDHLVKIWIYVVTILHWFNPFVWLAYSLCCKDMEISCDEAVLAKSKKNIRKEYAASLLKYAAKQNGYAMTPLTFGEPSVKSRIQNVLRYKKKNVFLSLLAGICVVGVAAGLLSRPSGNKNEQSPNAESNEVPSQQTAAKDGGNPPEDTAEEAKTQEKQVVNNGGQVIRVGSDTYYIDGWNLYSDGEKLFVSVMNDDGTWVSGTYELDGSGFRKIMDGRIVDSTEDGSVLYCMFQSYHLNSEYLGWYDTRTGESGSFSRGGNIDFLGRYDGYLYVSRTEEDGIYLDRIRESDKAAETDLLRESLPAGAFINSFYADGNYVLLAAGEMQGSMGSFTGGFYSYDLVSGESHETRLTDSGVFWASDGYIYYQKYTDEGSESSELFRAPYDFSEEQQIGEHLNFLKFDKKNNTILAAREIDSQGIQNLIRIHPDGSEEELLLDMAHMLGYSYDMSRNMDEVRTSMEMEERNPYTLAWNMEKGDKVRFTQLNILDGTIYVKAEQTGYREGTDMGWRDSRIMEIYLKISEDKQVSIWNPETLTPGWEDMSYLLDPVPGKPCDPQESGWKLENVTDVRDTFTSLPYTPEPGTEDNIYLLGKTENYTLYGKGDYEFMLLERNGRYSEIHYPYTSNYMTPLELMEFDFDGDGIEELAMKFNVKHGTGVYIDTLLIADFWGDGQFYVHQFLEEDFTAQLMEHLSAKRTEEGLQAYVDGKPLGKAMADDEVYGSYERVSVGGQVRFSYGDGSIFIEAELEFWSGDERRATSEYSGCRIRAELFCENEGRISLIRIRGEES